MIYRIPNSSEPLEQGDIIESCPIMSMPDPAPSALADLKAHIDFQTVIIITQTCDIANSKSNVVVVALVFNANELIELGTLKASEVKGNIRSHRVWGLYFLPANDDSGMEEMLVDLRRLYTINTSVLQQLRVAECRRARLLTPYREHMAKHFADTYSRIALPQPYETLP